MEKKQTAVEWFYDKIKSHFKHDGDLFESVIFTEAIANAEEKAQMFDAWLNGANQGKDSSDSRETLRMKFELFEQYYNKTYGKETDRS